MGEISEVKLYGVWSGSPSPTKRVEVALKLKGIPYEFIEEDLRNKSDMLVQYNPVHKKVPVLVHNGKPMAESHIILEYIDEQWNHSPRLLPEDPYERSNVRFWAKFYDQKFSYVKLVMSEGEERAKAIAEFIENLCILEDGIKRDFSGKSPFFHGENPGFLDMVIGSSACSYRVIEQVIGVKLIDPETHPLFYSWVTAMVNHPVVKETLPPHEFMVNFILNYKARK
ncbi:Glutathione s-transferase [Thalictrum thalictroides]|uniref:Glutathione S-transferase n=1 Tax=Thalictrum thalictroides TaxID=46969 RepID=A0A7J6WYS5_THATH|nr:Glutathione s-transferase [Thalictrum thalictroides]